MNDRELITKLNSDPEEGMRLLIEAYGGLVLSVARGRLKPAGLSQADAEACAADTFSEFWRRRSDYDPSRGSIRSVLCIMARSRAADMLSKAAASGRFEIGKSEIGLLGAEMAGIPDSFSFEGDFEDKVRRADVLKAVRELDYPDSEIIIRKYYLGQSSREIADVLGLSVSNVDTRTHRAIHKLREIFGGQT